MSLNIKVPQPELLKPRITIFGVGGAGGNAINNMIRSDLEGVEFIAANTDAQALTNSLAPNRIQLGAKTTKGLGAGSFPEKGREAAEENVKEIEKYLEGSNMVFIAAGMGGGTGTGGAPVIARLAKERGVLTVGVVTKPFHFEGEYRMQTAKKGIEDLKKHVDTLIVIPNQNLFRIANEQTTFESAFKMADDVLHDGVRGVTDLITMPGIVNLDFADIRTVMTKMGKAMMGTGEADGENRAVVACEAAISNPLLDDISIKGAKGVLVNMTGGPDMTLFEADMAVNTIKKEVDSNANIIFGSAFNENMEGKIRISVVATGIDIDELATSPQDEKNNSSRFNINAAQKDSKEVNDLIKDSDSSGFFDIGTAQKPDNDTISEINEVDLKSHEEYSKEPNLDYGKNESGRSEQVLETEFAQISFFGDNNEDKKQEEEKKEEIDNNVNEREEEPKEETPKKKEGFKLFGFLNKNKEKKKEKEEKSEEFSSIDDDVADEKEEVKKEKKTKLTQQEFFGTNFDDETAHDDEETTEEASEDDDVLNVPAFFRRKG